MKKDKIIFHLLATALCGTLCTACQSNDIPVDGDGQTTLSFSPTVNEIGNRESVTRATTNTFFKKGDKISVEITTTRGKIDAPFDYTMDNKGVFNGGFRFNLDNTYITELTAKWPTAQERKSGVILDQRILEDHQKADYLIAKSGYTNIMPTGEPLPLTFEHEQSRFTFRMAGQNANGLNIRSVILELQYDDPDDGTSDNISGAFWAYCDNTEMARLILLPGIDIKGTSNSDPGFQIVNGRYMIGMAEVGNATTKYTGGIWLSKEVAVTLQPNTDYLVTLTPEGYNLIANIQIGGFGQDEGFIGVPEKPQPQP